MVCAFFFFNDTATTEIYTLSLHDALPICVRDPARVPAGSLPLVRLARPRVGGEPGSRDGVLGDDRQHARRELRRVPRRPQIGRAHVLTPVTPISRMPSSA